MSLLRASECREVWGRAGGSGSEKPLLPQQSQNATLHVKKAVASLMAEVASSSSDESSDESSNVLSFPDRLTSGRVLIALVPGGKLQSPKELRARIKSPLELMQAAA